uniref:G-protein coupled receptors family 2 profile 2 domain-containing protein n=1 Tax=Amphiprion ocellaris TaxID=80972 RepID=A0A3Q1CLQ6_AMPOC
MVCIHIELYYTCNDTQSALHYTSHSPIHPYIHTLMAEAAIVSFSLYILKLAILSLKILYLNSPTLQNSDRHQSHTVSHPLYSCRDYFSGQAAEVCGLSDSFRNSLASTALISRNCTAAGWSKPSLPYYKACYHEAYEQDEDVGKEVRQKQSFTLSFSLTRDHFPLSSRKLLCTRNYIHLNLFVSFILRSLAVLIKDAVLFADKSMDHCTASTFQCKAAVTFFHFCVLSNFSWLLVEGLYLQTLLLLTFTQTRRLLWIYGVLGWGTVCSCVCSCWDNLESRLWWIIKIPILLSIFINLLIFLNISRIIVQKMKARNTNQSETRVYRTLVRSTLLLIPLFGLHYVLFALIPENVGVRPRLYLELVLGSFQGFIVAVLYCFLNGEVSSIHAKKLSLEPDLSKQAAIKTPFMLFQVQKEIQRGMRRCCPETKTSAINPPTQEDVP